MFVGCPESTEILLNWRLRTDPIRAFGLIWAVLRSTMHVLCASVAVPPLPDNQFMPFLQGRYLLATPSTGEPARFVCLCGDTPTWHSGAPDRPDLPLQLRCDNCLRLCAEFLTFESRDWELAELHERAVAMNQEIAFDKPKFPH